MSTAWDISGSGAFLSFSGKTLRSIPNAIVRRPVEVLGQFERVAWGSLPIALAAGLSVGLVTWLQTRRMLVTYSIESTLPSVLAVAVLVETGPMLAGLLVAGKMGAGLGAELGTMVLTEEIEARAVLGAATIPTLVAPRALACALALPILTILLDASALLGGLAAELAAGKMSALEFAKGCLLLLRLTDVVPATLKTSVFGLLVGLVGCWCGLSAQRSAESVGRAATRGVVGAMLAVFGSNVVMVPCLQAAVAALGWKG